MVGSAPQCCWQPWECVVRLDTAGPIALRARATDATGRTQPERAEWNRLGYGNNSIQVVVVSVR
jgi:hypothetical protein